MSQEKIATFMELFTMLRNLSFISKRFLIIVTIYFSLARSKSFRLIYAKEGEQEENDGHEVKNK